MPDKLKGRLFEKLFEAAEIAKFTPDQVRSYEDSLKYYRDLKNSLDTARDEGVEEGIEKGKIEGKAEGVIEGIEKGKVEGKIEIAKNLINKGFSISEIVDLTGLSKEEIEEIKNEN